MADKNYELKYSTYNPGQYPEQLADIDAMVEDGWRVLTALPAYTELYILWHRGTEVSGQLVEAQTGEVHCPGCQCPVESPADKAEDTPPE